MIAMRLRLVVPVLAALVSSAHAQAPATQPHRADDKRPTAKHVLLIGLDGARADAIRDHAGPAIQSLIDNGTSCWRAQAVTPSVTQVNWASVLTGCRPDTHGINTYPQTQPELEATPLKVPTLFDLVARSGMKAAGFLGHWKLYPLESKTPGATTFRSSYESVVVGADAAKYILAEKPAFCFVFIGDLDGKGHRHGWMSPEYLDGVKVVDRAVQKLLDALDQAGIREQTVVMLTSDHGGHGKSHSQGTSEDLTIPWIACGPGIARGATIDREISTLDTAPTVLAALGLNLPATSDGKIVREAFTGPAAPSAALPVKPATRPVTPAVTRPATRATGDSRVLIITVDGLRPDLALLTDMPKLRGLLKEGTYTFWARTTELGITLPSHTSMLTGVTPARHGITWNDDDGNDQGVRYPNYPTLFELAKKAGYTTALVGAKSKFNALTKPGTLDHADIPSPEENSRRNEEVATRAAELIVSRRPQVMMVHLGDVDRAGHGAGWATPPQIAAIQTADAAIGKVLAALRASGKYDDTLIIVTADHGGFGRTHGRGDVRSAFIPWIAIGPGVRRDFDLTRHKDVQVRTEDTFATACHFLSLNPAPDIDGRNVAAAFLQDELLIDVADAPKNRPASRPSIAPRPPVRPSRTAAQPDSP
jgi:predicted AlkP superfamily pyrophosphatase or phosphodiesterase